MKITNEASNAVLQTMLRRGLNPKTTFFEVGVVDGNVSLRFIRERTGRVVQFGPLGVIVNNSVPSDCVMDFVEVNGRKGLIFTGEKECQSH